MTSPLLSTFGIALVIVNPNILLLDEVRAASIRWAQLEGGLVQDMERPNDYFDASRIVGDSKRRRDGNRLEKRTVA